MNVFINLVVVGWLVLDLGFYLYNIMFFINLLNSNLKLLEWGGYDNTKFKIKREMHSFHLVEPSPYPIMTSFFLFGVVMSVVLRLNGLFFYSGIFFCISFFFFLISFFGWFHDIVLESRFYHTFNVRQGLSLGMLLFILSEVMFFFSFFWAFFHSSISPSIQIGVMWPPKGIESVSFLGLPLLNTVILLLSGLSLTWAHKSVTSIFKYTETNCGLLITIILGFIFSLFQAEEYWSSCFSITDSVYGSVFFMATGFHGFHVFVGACLLLVCLVRHVLGHFTTTHHIGFIASIWYWHFVDVVWLFLYATIYCWGGF